MKHIICFSGGHSSALVAIEVVRKYGKQNVILLNHNINSKKESHDIKRFKIEIAAYLDIPITYCNYQDIQDPNQLPNQFDIARQYKIFKRPKSNKALCTYYLKTKPFEDWIYANFPTQNTFFQTAVPATVYYGFDATELNRILRRSSILAAMGYKTAFPLAHWNRTIKNTQEIGILPPQQYNHYKHANCIGCLKGGIQHWYVTYVHAPDIFQEAKETEEQLGYSILKRKGQACYLEELAPIFEQMKKADIPASEHYPKGKFRKALKAFDATIAIDEVPLPCECLF